VGETLNNLGNLEMVNNEFEKAKDLFLEALDIYQKSIKVNYERYLPGMATSLNSLGALFYTNNDIMNAEYYLSEALKIRNQLVKEKSSNLSNF